MDNFELTPERITAYGLYLKQEERTPATLEKYLRDVRAFACWLNGDAVTKEAVTGWKERLLAERRAPSTVNAALSALNGLFRFLGWESCRARFVKVQRRLFRDPARELTRPDYDRLIAAARELGRERLALVMETICATGVRVSEVRYFTVEAVWQGRAEISLKGKVRVILIPTKLARKLLKYAKKNKTVSGEIFLTGNGKSLSRRQIWAEMKRLCAHAGVEPSKVFPHNLRHYFATAYYRAYKDIAKLADVLGHSSIETTRIYLLTSGTEHQRQLDRLGLVS
ncbi:tyrosine-type recombinase/integrase [Dysosmobacter sp.]|uniref:tyrosine-type recombinase/integrase n=1 Tax=Dysosmobacter sp. TaxID=2591382 RepID=UPI003AF035A0